MDNFLPGFADPVRESQAVFRAVMDAMARPGKVERVAGPVSAPAPLGRATAAVLLTLVDAESPLWLDPAAAAASPWIAFHCGAPQAARAQAAFALSLGAAGLDTLAAGSDEEPERSATLILQVAALGTGPRLRLTGPGLEAAVTLAVDGLPEGFLAEWEANRRLFPRGVDLVLTAGDAVAALPRTVRIEAV